MASQKLQQLAEKSQYTVPPLLKPLALAALGLGLAGWVVGLFTNVDAAWRAFLTSYIYWLGLAAGCLAWSFVLRITNARWGRSMLRLFEGAAFFLPVALVLYVVLVIGGYTSHLYPWAHHPIVHKELWLNPGFVFGRQAVLLILFIALCVYYVYQSLKSDVAVARESKVGSDLFRKLFGALPATPADHACAQKKLKRLAPGLALLYAIVMSAFAFDLIMSLEPYWYSTMFGGYYFVGNMYLGLGFMAIVATMVRRGAGLEHYIGKNQFWDLGKLFFAFTMLWTYLMWAQYLPIWYSNMHEEIGYIIKRAEGPYRVWSFVLLAMIWVIPWVILLPKRSKQTPAIFIVAAVIGMVGLWLERWTLVIPSQFEVAPVPVQLAVFPNWLDISAFLLIGGLFLFSYRFFLKHFPVVAIGDTIMVDIAEGRANDGHHH